MYPVVLPAFSVSAILPYSPYKGVLHAAVAMLLIWLALSLAGRPRAGTAAAQSDGAAVPLTG
jgi:hypothetical protein